jgi:hypothetical protein
MPHLKHSHLKAEEFNRLFLWLGALHQTSSLLALAARAALAAESETVKERDAAHTAAMHQWISQRPDYEPGTQKLSHFLDFEELIPRPLGCAVDMYGYRDACQMLAIVFFCQVFKSGYAEVNAVSDNRQQFVAAHLEALYTLAAFTLEDRVAFELLRESIETARDGMLAHADGEAYAFRENPVGFSVNLPSKALERIDFPLFKILVGRLQKALHAYLVPTAA